ncbi:hypothetical protein EHR06_03000 [Leptospira dzoumogneensis]|uniref:Uncharacterized protein n=1 Tax=Leptospira dzoumogneensis TaxID=2484904 RepID=A0A4Z1AHM3_9LEPT|nr:hypothetical protein EHR06_03000 [Leptospira dzoumogneensis]
MLPLRSWIASATTRSGYATFASITALAEQTRAVVNVGTPWSFRRNGKIHNIELSSFFRKVAI